MKAQPVKFVPLYDAILCCEKVNAPRKQATKKQTHSILALASLFFHC